jgi:heat shock protein HspQ
VLIPWLMHSSHRVRGTEVTHCQFWCLELSTAHSVEQFHWKRPMGNVRRAKFHVGQVVRHRVYPFRGIIFDIDPVFDNTEEWWQSIPAEVRPKKDQPFYHLLAENAHTEYIAYVSEQNLLPDATGQPLRHPQVGELFAIGEDGSYRPLFLQQPH